MRRIEMTSQMQEGEKEKRPKEPRIISKNKALLKKKSVIQILAACQILITFSITNYVF